MAQKRPFSTYGNLSCDLFSTIPKRNIREGVCSEESKMQSKPSRPLSFSQGIMSKETNVSKTELPADQGYVKRRTIFFENISTDTIGDETSKSRQEPSVEIKPKVIKYRIQKSNYGYSAPRHRKSEIIMRRVSQYEINDNGIIRQVKNDDFKSNFPKKKISRQHTIQCTSSSPSKNRGQSVNKIAKDKPQTSSKNELKPGQRQKNEATNENEGVREAPDELLPVPAVSCRPEAKPLGTGRRRCESENLSTKNIITRSLSDADAMSDSWHETLTVPRIVAASVKSYKDIPEELFNSLPESSVDPSSDGDEPQGVKSEWKNMLKVRHALQSSAPEFGRPIKEEHYSMKNKSERGFGKDITVIREEKKLHQKNNLKSNDFVKHRETNRKMSSTSNCPSVETSEYQSQLERELRANGIYFRLPPPPPTNPGDENYSPDVEVKVALDTLDASLEGFCSNSSSESVSLARSRSSSGNEPQSNDRSRSENVSNGELKVRDCVSNKNQHSFKEKPFYKDCIVVSNDNFYIKQSPERTIIHVSNKMGDEESSGEKSESFNLIEEVYVSSRTKTIPDSTVQMKAYYPSVDFTKAPATLKQLTIDNDSGHESGATSPCGTLTGEDTLTPPASPSTLKQNENLNCTIQGHLPKEENLKSKNSKNKSLEINTDLTTAVAAHSETDDCVREVIIEEPPSVHFVVVAIDFGTTYSGYAFSFTRDPENIHMMKKWEGGDPGIQNEKTPTIVLLTPDEEFHSLGFAARDTFHDLDPKEAQKWLYFDKFKMELHSNKALTRDTLLTAKNGKQVPALKIFYLALRYFRDHAIKELTEQTGIEVEDEDIRWVITVPAIWSHPAKQFMRTAAYQAGMGSPSRQDKLLIALEPEAAAIYCRRLKQNQLLQDKSTESKLKQLSSISSSGSVRSIKGNQDEHIPELDRDELVSRSLKKNEKVGDWLKKGTTYMVVDCGGGTVDITVHQMTDRRSGHLKELHKATGGSYGSIGVDKEFEELLNIVFGSDFMSLFKEQRSASYVNLMIAFESRKRNASPYKSSPLNIALPFSFIDFYKKTCKKEVESAIKKHSDLGIKWSPQGMLRIEQETMKKLFTPTLEKISEAIRSVLSSPEVEGIIQYMFLVGGFSESELLQKHIRETFSHEINVIIPQGMGLAILRGAVQFGLDPSVVTVRRSRLTYGVGILNTFIEEVHPPEKKVLAAGREWCADILDRFVEVDESVALGDVVTRSYTPATPTQKSVILHLYATSQQHVKYVTDPSVEKVGTLHLDLGKRLKDSSDSETPRPSEDQTPNEAQPQQREITVHLNFGGTEIKASAVDHYTGQCVKTTIEFLSL